MGESRNGGEGGRKGNSPAVTRMEALLGSAQEAAVAELCSVVVWHVLLCSLLRFLEPNANLLKSGEAILWIKLSEERAVGSVGKEVHKRSQWTFETSTPLPFLAIRGDYQVCLCGCFLLM